MTSGVSPSTLKSMSEYSFLPRTSSGSTAMVHARMASTTVARSLIQCGAAEFQISNAACCIPPRPATLVPPRSFYDPPPPLKIYWNSKDKIRDEHARLRPGDALKGPHAKHNTQNIKRSMRVREYSSDNCTCPHQPSSYGNRRAICNIQVWRANSRPTNLQGVLYNAMVKLDSLVQTAVEQRVA